MNSLTKLHTPKPIENLQTPTFWPNSVRTTAVQVHTAKHANLLKKSFEARRIAFACHGPRLEVFEILKSLESGSAWLTSVLPDAKEVYGGDPSDSLKRPSAK